ADARDAATERLHVGAALRAFRSRFEGHVSVETVPLERAEELFEVDRALADGVIAAAPGVVDERTAEVLEVDMPDDAAVPQEVRRDRVVDLAVIREELGVERDRQPRL